MQNNEKHQCARCNEFLKTDRIVWLELSFATGLYHRPEENAIPMNESQGLHPFGADCAKIMLAKGKEIMEDSEWNPKNNQCAECRNGEHEDYQDDAKLVTVRDPEAGKLAGRMKLCSEHIEMRLMDGYEVIYNGKRL